MVEIKRIFDVLRFQLENYPLKKALNVKRRDQWKEYSSQNIINIVNFVSISFIRSWCKKGR